MWLGLSLALYAVDELINVYCVAFKFLNTGTYFGVSEHISHYINSYHGYWEIGVPVYMHVMYMY